MLKGCKLDYFGKMRKECRGKASFCLGCRTVWLARSSTPVTHISATLRTAPNSKNQRFSFRPSWDPSQCWRAIFICPTSVCLLHLLLILASSDFVVPPKYQSTKSTPGRNAVTVEIDSGTLSCTSRCQGHQQSQSRISRFKTELSYDLTSHIRL